MSGLGGLFPAGDFRFHLTLRRGPPADFFRPQDPTGKILAERAHWLATEPARYAALTEAGEPLLKEFAEMCNEWPLQVAPASSRPSASTLSEVAPASSRPSPSSPASPPPEVPPASSRPPPSPPLLSPPASSASPASPAILTLGAHLEPDFLLLSPDANGTFRLRGGALCFPTGWALEEKLGHTLDFIHGVVPGLNPALASPIQQFLTRLKPGLAFLRDNWGLTATPELNLHPARRLPAPDLPTAPDRLWLRVEHQALVALPRSRGVVFGLRIALHRLDEVARDPVAAAGLRHALLTLPPELAAYKRVDRVSNQVVSWL